VPADPTSTAPGSGAVGDATTALEVQPIAGHIGAEIHGVDVRSLTDGDVAAIRAALLRWKVVFFHDQTITPAEQVAFGRRFGVVTPAHPTLPPAFPDQPEILLLDYETDRDHGDDGDPFRIEHRWHTDVSYLAAPPMGSILHAIDVPPYGGDTQFTNLAIAYQQLSAPIRDLVEGLQAVHHNVLPIDRGEYPSDLANAFRASDLRAVHPVVRVHPETGEKVLFVNPNFTSHIVGLSRRESAHVLTLLYEQIANQTFTCRFRWRRGSIAFWDNRATAHLIPTDLPTGWPRVLHRITIAGEPPTRRASSQRKTRQSHSVDGQLTGSDPPLTVDLDEGVPIPTAHHE
jgi:alpha-ketoglutarate-dependent taurine dioxygenase